MTFDEILNKIEFKLKDKYPMYDITFEHISPHKISLIFNKKSLYKFDPLFIKKETEFITDHKQYLDFLFSFFDEYAKPYHKKKSSALRTSTYGNGLSLQQVESTIKATKSNMQAARYLSISYPTWKKYSSQYKHPDGVSYFEKHKNPTGVGIPKFFGPLSKRYNIDDLLNGLHPSYPPFKLKNRLIKLGKLEEKCKICGFEEHRIGDARVPLMMDFEDGNPLNRSLSNIRLLCYNCYFMYVGDIFWRRKGDFMAPNGANTGHFQKGYHEKFDRPKNIISPSVNQTENVKQQVGISINDLEKETNENS